MSHNYENNEKFRELCSIGDLELVQQYYQQNKPDVLSSNKMNGWTCLHWACKRNHYDVVKYLLEVGAQVDAKNFDGRTAQSYANSQISKLISPLSPNKENDHLEVDNCENKIIPNYLSHPQFHYSNANYFKALKPKDNDQKQELIEEKTTKNVDIKDSITVRIRLNTDKDFIEFDIDRLNTTIEQFKMICYQELDNFDKSLCIKKIRKLPNILIRNTNDIKRLKNEQEIEIEVV
jgi:ankyrin repeat protein